MTDLRALLTDAVFTETALIVFADTGDELTKRVAAVMSMSSLRLADVLLSLPGIVITELPEPKENDGPDWRGEGWSVWPDIEVEPPELVIRSAISLPADEGRAFAAALLAAANAAEEK